MKSEQFSVQRPELLLLPIQEVSSHSTTGVSLSQPSLYVGGFLALAADIQRMFGIVVDHFHAHDDVGEVMVLRMTNSEGVVRYLTLTGYAPDPNEFQHVVGHKFHGGHDQPVRVSQFEVDLFDEHAPRRPESGFAKFMKRLTSW